jgi:hypothetical protein
MSAQRLEGKITLITGRGKGEGYQNIVLTREPFLSIIGT